MSQPHQQRNKLQRRQQVEFCKCIRPVMRTFGLLTSFVICGVGVDVYMHGYLAGIFILFLAFLVFFIELKWLIAMFLQLQYGNAPWLECWLLSKKLDGWWPMLIYVAMGVILIIYPYNLWLSYVAGLLLLLLAVFRMFERMKSGKEAGNLTEESLLSQCDLEKDSSFVESGEDDNEFNVSKQDNDRPAMFDEVC